MRDRHPSGRAQGALLQEPAKQLACDVAQPKKAVERSVLSQQQIIADMQQLAGRRAKAKA